MTGVRVLIVDDSVTIRAMLEHIISADVGCDVVGVAADAAAAHRMMTTKQPDVMTLDLMMPGIDGLQFLRGIQGAQHAPIIVVSSNGKPEARNAALEAGAVAYFDKAVLLADAPQFLRELRKAAEPEPFKVRRKSPRRALNIGNDLELRGAE